MTSAAENGEAASSEYPQLRDVDCAHYWLEVPAISVGILSAALRRKGRDPVAILKSVGISPEVMYQPGRRVGWAQEMALQAKFAALTDGDFQAWVEVGRQYSFPAFEAFGLAMVVSPTLRHFRDTIVDLKAKYTGAMAFPLPDADGWTGMEFIFPANSAITAQLSRFSVIRDLVAAVTMLESLWQGPFPMKCIGIPFAMVPPGLASALSYRLESSIDRTRLVWSSNLMDVRLPRGNEGLFQLYLDQASRSDSWVRAPSEIDHQTLTLLKQPGNCGLEIREVAAKLGLSPRTLQRRLSGRNASFQELREAARQHESKRLLTDTDLPISIIADRVGYFEVASFSNAFRRWNGESPTSFREHHTSDR
ncbi:helix-turn-helix domain-containing protein [Sphingobium sp. JS3065]|uniref:helix-turn-helix domain-containing protein n=1 Tax=Sphingobium sp. JS3065 TaxID=2970925 RepID=UPI002263D405|nr:helix-turn-helix domain-containing protein [Sphingobium sp. JS3065]UZW57250.1 helix-turn-helix domain-containing protein [Sphingobium sp. JS3065]